MGIAWGRRFARGATIIAVLLLSLAACAADDDEPSAGPPDPDMVADDAAGALDDDEQDAFWNYADNGEHFSYQARQCAGTEIVRRLGAEAVNEIVATGRASEEHANVLYEALDECAYVDLVAIGVQASVPDVRIEQSRCFMERAPDENTTKEITLAALQGLPLPEPSPAVTAQLRDAMLECFTPEQIRGAAQRSSTGG